MGLFKNRIKQVKEIRDLQKQSIEKTKDDYMVGLYNGLEFAIAILEKKEPIFMDCVREPEVIERTESGGRTIASGIRRR